MKKIRFIFCFLFINCINTQAQIVQFDKNYHNGHDAIWNVLEVPGGGYICNMIVSAPPDGKAIAILRLDNYGNTIYQKKYGSINEINYSYSFLRTSDSNFITGSYAYVVNANTYVIYLMKLDLNGDSLWKKYIYAPPGFVYHCAYVIETSDKGFLITGGMSDSLFQNVNGVIVKTDSLGNEQWHISYGGIDADYLYSSVETPDKGFLSVGTTQSFGAVNLPYTDIYLVKTDSLGVFQWQKTFGTINAEDAVCITKTYDGNYLLCGTDEILGNQAKSSLRKIDANGNLIWQNTYGNNIQSRTGWWAQELPNHNIVGAGEFFDNSIGYSNGYVWSTDSGGNMLWERGYNNNLDCGFFRYVRPTNDGGLICTGSVCDGTAGSNQDGWLVKLDRLGCLANDCGVLTTDIAVEGLSKDNNFFIYPNPTDGLINIKNNVKEDNYFVVTIFNSMGQQVLQKRFLNISLSLYQMSLNEFDNGLYFVKIGNEKHWEIKKILKE